MNQAFIGRYNYNTVHKTRTPEDTEHSGHENGQTPISTKHSYTNRNTRSLMKKTA